MTMETSAVWTARSSKSPRGFIVGSDAWIIIGGAKQARSDHNAYCANEDEENRKAERADPHNPPQKLSGHWYAAVTGGIPPLWHIVAVCYWAIVILLGWYPWNILLMLLSLPAMDFSRRDQTALCRDRCLADTEAPR
jgi:hypothetical protein